MRARTQGRRTRRLAIAALALLPALAIAAASARPAGGDSWHAVSSTRYDYSLRVPDGWRRSDRRLVPLVMPREVLSVGTFAMTPGGGGECDREPIASLGRMRSGDALITVQEYAVTPSLRTHLSHNFPPLPSRSDLASLPRSPSAGAPPGTYLSKVSFNESGRAFDALVYFHGRPDAEQRWTAASILAGLRFGPHA